MTHTPKHTPGPWSINAVRNEAEKLLIVDADMCFVADIWQTYVNGKSRQQDNAHLIAAAPAMYEALREIVAAVEAGEVSDYSSAGDWYTEARAALAQAEGRQ